MLKPKTLYECLVSIILNDYSTKPDSTHILMAASKLILQNRSLGDPVLSQADIGATKQEIKNLDDFFEKEQLDPDLIYKRLLLLDPYFEKSGKKLFSMILQECMESSNTSKEIDVVCLVNCIIENHPDISPYFKKGSSQEQFEQLRKTIIASTPTSDFKSQIPQDAIKKTLALISSTIKKEESTDISEVSPASNSTDTPTLVSDNLSVPEDLASLMEQAKILRSALYDIVFGQDIAIRTFIRGYYTAQMITDKSSFRKGPQSIYLFAVPPGVGKTLLAVSAAEILKVPYYVLNMSQIILDPDSALNEFLHFVRKNTDCILIIDEFEKAPSTILKLFLQILDTGILKKTNFCNAHMIFTTNAGRKMYEDMRGRKLSLLNPAAVLSALASEKKTI